MPPTEDRKQHVKTEILRVKVTPEQAAELKTLAKIHRCTVPELFRRGIPVLKQSALALQAGVNSDLVLLGDDLTVKAKQQALEAFRQLKGPARAAKAGGVTLRTIRYWVESDPVFRQMAEEGAALAVELVEGQLVKLAHKGNLSAIFGVLNAKHPDYGQIRPHMMLRYLKPLFEIVVKRVATYLRPADLDRFAAELRGDLDDFAREQGRAK